MDKRKDILYHPVCIPYSCTMYVRRAQKKRCHFFFVLSSNSHLLKSSSRTKKIARKSYCIRCNNGKWMWIDGGFKKIYIYSPVVVALFSFRCQKIFDWINGNGNGNGKYIMLMLFRWTDISIDDYTFSHWIWLLGWKNPSKTTLRQ